MLVFCANPAGECGLCRKGIWEISIAGGNSVTKQQEVMTVSGANVVPKLALLM